MYVLARSIELNVSHTWSYFFFLFACLVRPCCSCSKLCVSIHRPEAVKHRYRFIETSCMFSVVRFFICVHTKTATVWPLCSLTHLTLRYCSHVPVIHFTMLKTNHVQHSAPCCVPFYRSPALLSTSTFFLPRSSVEFIHYVAFFVSCMWKCISSANIILNIVKTLFRALSSNPNK